MTCIVFIILCLLSYFRHELLSSYAQEPHEERLKFQAFLNTYGEHRFARPAPNYPERDFVASQDPEEWKMVEALIPPKLVPTVPQREYYPSGFVPATAKFGDYPYHVHRTANHMLPVYVDYSRRRQILRTCVRRVDGNLFALRDDLKDFLFERYKMDFISQVAEVFGKVVFRGDFQEDFKSFLLARGF